MRILAVVAGALLAGSAIALPMLTEGIAMAPTSDAGQVYAAHCASCHGADLGGGFGPALKSAPFVAHWGKASATDLAQYMATAMPPAAPNSLSPASYAALAVFVRDANGIGGASAAISSATPPTAAGAALPQWEMSDAVKARLSDAHLVSRHINNDAIAQRQAARLAGTGAAISPVSDAMLQAPAAGEWPTWRRSRALTGFSPLDQIDRGNASRLGVAWSLALPEGTNGIEPLVHDGVLFFNASGTVQALDATNGDLIWAYARPASSTRVPVSQPRGMTLYGTALIVPTIDNHMLALDARTGKLLWDHAIAPADAKLQITGAPLAVDGKIIQGMAGCFGAEYPGGCFIFALDARDGHELWRFDTIARPGTPQGNSWNGAPLADRFGASVWTGGSYDPETKLVYFGVGQTYKISTLLDPGPAKGANRDALFTDSTLALDPNTGRLAWYYQHMPTDVWDLDWSFEQTLLTLPGSQRRVIATAGKPGILDVLDARTGQYLWSVDPGVQTLISAIDPKTGRKTIDPSLYPVRGASKTLCPSPIGGRNWPATATDPGQRLLFMPLVAACTEISRRDSITGDMEIWITAPPGNDGNFGRLVAIDLAAHKIAWTDRDRAPPASAMLATGGGLLFAGGIDRWFRALDSATGKTLWQSRLDNTPNGFPISYTAKGRQYVTVITGGNSPYDASLRMLTPEIGATRPSRTMWTFALPEAQNLAQ